MSTNHPCVLLYDEVNQDVCISSPNRLYPTITLTITSGGETETIDFTIPLGTNINTSDPNPTDCQDISSVISSFTYNVRTHCPNANGAFEGINNVEILQIGSTTNQAGDYSLSSLTDANLTLDPRKTDNASNGVSTFDLFKISKHVLQITPLATAYEKIAADVNTSGSITTFDIVEIRKVILEINEVFPVVDSWEFVKASHVFPSQAPYAFPSFPSSIQSIQGTVPIADADFIGIKMGDVSCNANNTTQFSPCDDDNELEILIEEKALRANDVYTVAVRTNNFKDIGAYQFSLGYDKTKLEYQSIQEGDLNRGAKADNFKVPTIGSGNPGGGNKEQINTLWLYNDASDLGFTVLDTTLTDTASLFLVTFKALVNIPAISQVINLQTQNFDAAAWSDGGDCARNVTMAFLPEGFAANRNAGQSVSENMTSSVRVHPNPTVGDLVFEIITALSSENSIQIYNTTGQQVLKQKIHLEKGSNTVAMDNISSWQDGLYFFTITDSSGAFISGKFVKQ